MTKTSNTILTENPTKALLRFALPIFAGNMLQQLYSMVDSVVVGNTVSAGALAAVGNAFPITYMVICVSFGLSNGSSILVGQYTGAGKTRDMRALIRTSVLYAGAVGAVLMLLCLALSHTLVGLLDTPAELFPLTLQYVRIYFAGLVFTFCFNMISGLFRALGDSVTPLIFLAVSSVLNIALDLLFVLAFRMGVSGVAIATVISQAIAMLLQLAALRRRAAEFPEDKGAKLIDLAALKSLTKLALPTTSQELLISINIFVTQMFVNRFGEDVMAAFTAVGKIGDLGMMPMISMGVALTVFSAQNVGAGRTDRASAGFRAGYRFNLCVAVILALVALFLGRPLMQMFLGENGTPEIYAAGQEYLNFTAVSFFCMATSLTAEGVIKGAGDVNLFFAIAVCGASTKVVAALLLMPSMGSRGIWLSIVLSWGVEAILVMARYLSGRWKTKAVTGGAEQPSPEDQSTVSSEDQSAVSSQENV